MMGKYGLHEFRSGQGHVAGSSEHSNEPSRSVEHGEFLNYPMNY
jgi:hypothetical protein